MNKIIFAYNKENSKCNFCDRKRNPHPDYDEALVTTVVNLHHKKIEICINCFEELETFSKKINKSIKEIIIRKLNIINILNKNG